MWNIDNPMKFKGAKHEFLCINHVNIWKVLALGLQNLSRKHTNIKALYLVDLDKKLVFQFSSREKIYNSLCDLDMQRMRGSRKFCKMGSTTLTTF